MYARALLTHRKTIVNSATAKDECLSCYLRHGRLRQNTRGVVIDLRKAKDTKDTRVKDPFQIRVTDFRGLFMIITENLDQSQNLIRPKSEGNNGLFPSRKSESIIAVRHSIEPITTLHNNHRITVYCSS